MRAGVLAVVALVSAALGAAGVLVVGRAAGWVGEGEARTVVVSTVSQETGPNAPAAAPLLGNGFDPARIYASRSAGVVTINAFFDGGERAQGSGFVVSDDGHILTNSHVVTNARDGGTARGASRVYVVFADGDRIPASIVGWDLFNDTGVVKVNPRDHDLAPVPLGDSSRVVVGEPVAAIGSPFGQESSLAVGVVSATERSIASMTSAYEVAGAIQIDAPINRGNSGGPLFDARGRVIGINAQISSESGTAEGVGFAIPINSARRSMEQLLATGRVAYAYVGVTTQDITPAIAKRYELGAPRGALIQTVVDRRAGREGRTARRHGRGDLQRHPDQSRGRPDRLLRGPTGPARRRHRPDRHRAFPAWRHRHGHGSPARQGRERGCARAPDRAADQPRGLTRVSSAARPGRT